MFVHHYISSKTKTLINGTQSEIIQQTDYPESGHIVFLIKENNVEDIAFRIPFWCEKYNFTINGREADITIKKGYAYINLDQLKMATIEITFDMKIQLIETLPEVQENSGRVVLQRGPVIYCLEAVDNGNLLRDVRISKGSNFKLIRDDYFEVALIEATGYRRKTEEVDRNLYQPLNENLESIQLKFIPYYSFANRGESEMIVWVLKA